MESEPLTPWTKDEWENRSPHPIWKEKFDKRTALTIDRLEFYQEREADICKAVGSISDGGRYRNDIIEHLLMLMKVVGSVKEALAVLTEEKRPFKISLMTWLESQSADYKADVHREFVVPGLKQFAEKALSALRGMP